MKTHLIPVTNDSVSPERYEAVKANMAQISLCAAPTSIPAAVVPVVSLPLAEKQIQSKMKHSVNTFKGIMICADLNFKAGTMKKSPTT